MPTKSDELAEDAEEDGERRLVMRASLCCAARTAHGSCQCKLRSPRSVLTVGRGVFPSKITSNDTYIRYEVNFSVSLKGIFSIAFREFSLICIGIWCALPLATVSHELLRHLTTTTRETGQASGTATRAKRYCSRFLFHGVLFCGNRNEGSLKRLGGIKFLTR